VLKRFRSHFVARVRDVFRFKYQSFGPNGNIANDWHQVVVLTEWCQGGELVKYIADRQCEPSDNEVLQWTLQMAAGLRQMHEQDVLHRNLNPGNVYLDTHGTVRLASFQFAKVARPVTKLLTHLRCAGGSPMTRAPELERMVEPDDKADVWALGCVLFSLMTGTPPVNLAGRPIEDIVDSMSLRFSSCTRQVLRMCLQPDRELRASAKQVFCYLKGGIKLSQPVHVAKR